MTTQQLRINLPKTDLEALDRIAHGMLSRQAIAGMLLHAAIEAVLENPSALRFPPVFSVGNPIENGTALVMNDPPPRYKPKK